MKQYAEISGEDEEQLKSSGVTNQSLNLNTLLGSTQTQKKIWIQLLNAIQILSSII